MYLQSVDCSMLYLESESSVDCNMYLQSVDCSMLYLQIESSVD